MKVGYCLAVALSLLALALVLASFVGVNPEVPEQVPYRFTGYPTWLPKLKGYDPNQLDATLLFNQILLLVSSYFGLKWAFNPPTNRKLITRFYSTSDRDAASIPTTDFDRVLAMYIVLTLLCGLTIFIAGVGKIWVAVGVLHNAAEFAILVMLGSGQGLCFDWALIIEFTRIYVTTLRELRLQHRDNLEELVEPEDDDPFSHHRSYHAILSHPHQILLLIIGAVFHIAGNIAFTVFRFSFYALLAFFFSYCVTYPAYAYYIYLDLHVTSNHPQKRIYLPENPWWK
ncbi:16858_t:CDS:2, partial [Dentiscutata heterogama]